MTECDPIIIDTETTEVIISDDIPNIVVVDGLKNTNAEYLQGYIISTTAPTDGQLLVFNNTDSVWNPVSFSTSYLTDFSLTDTASGDILYNDGTNWVNLVKGDDGQFLSLANGVPSWTTNQVQLDIGDTVGSGTSGSILFVDASGNLAQNNTKLFWNDTNNRLGIGTNTASEALEVIGNILASGTITGSNLSGVNTGDQESSDFTHNNLSSLQGGTTDEYYHLTSAQHTILSPTTATLGGVVFGDGTGLTQDASNLFWDNTNNRLGIGTTSPTPLSGYSPVLNIAGASPGITFTDTGSANNSRYITTNAGYMSFGKMNDDGTGGAGHMYIGSTGKVGIGTTDPQEKLSVIGSDGTANLVQISNTDMGTGNDQGLYVGVTTGDEGYIGTRSDHDFVIDTNNTERVRILNSGNVGIGTTSPNTLLYLSASDNAKLTIEGTHNNDLNAGSIYLLGSNANPTTKGQRINFGDQDDNNIGMITYSHYASGADTDYMSFTTNASEAMRIDSTGNVGIGTTAPEDKLHILTTNSGYGATIESQTSGHSVVLRLKNTYGGGAGQAGWSIGTNSIAYNDFVLTDLVNDERRFYINNAGNVGIGTTNPAKPLDVVGGAIFGQSGGDTPLTVTSTDDKALIQINDDDTTGYIYAQNGFMGLGGVSGISAQNINVNTTSGNVGIGTTGPTNKLEVKSSSGSTANTLLTTNDYVGSSTGSSLQFYFGASSGNTYSKISAFSAGGSAWNNLILQSGGGNVGVGTTNPATPLHIDSGNNVQMRIQGDSEYRTTFYIDGDDVSNIYTHNGTSLGDLNLGQISGTPGIYFKGSTGNVGIGITSPNTILDVGVASAVGIRVSDTGDGNKVRVELGDSAAGGGYLNMYDDTETSTVLIRSYTVSGVQGYFNAGNIGIGTTSPTAVLHLKAGTATAGTAPIKFTDGTLLTTPEPGVLNYVDDKFYVTCVGTQRVIDRTSDVKLSTTTVTNTTTEILVYTGVVPANSLKAGNILKLNMSGTIDEAAASDEVTIRVKMGGVTIATVASPASGISDKCWHIRGIATLRSIGASGSMAWYIDMNADTGTTEACDITTVDTTAAEDVTVTAQWNNAKAGNVFTCTQGFMEYKN